MGGCQPKTKALMMTKSWLSRYFWLVWLSAFSSNKWKKGKGGSCLVDQVKHLVYNNGPESANLKLTTIHSEKRVPALKSFESWKSLCWTKNFGPENIFGPKIFLVPKYFESQNIWGLKLFWVKKKMSTLFKVKNFEHCCYFTMVQREIEGPWGTK